MKNSIVATVFFGLGVLGFIGATGFFTTLSETALVNGAMSFLIGLSGAIGAHKKRESIGKAIGFGILFAIGMMVFLAFFFGAIWPSL